LGATEYAVVSDTRYFRARLADDLAQSIGVTVAPILNLSGLAVQPDRNLRVGGVEILGVDPRFWELGDGRDFNLGPGQAVINERLAQRLGAHLGDQILIRLQRPEVIPGEMPFALERSETTALRVGVTAIAGNEEFGRFSLNANQMAPFNLFLSLPWLSEALYLNPRANILLIPEGKEINAGAIGSALQEVWSLSDIGLTLDPIPDSEVVELRSERVFLEKSVTEAALVAGDKPSGIFTYLVNSIRSEAGSTPYSFVSAAGQLLEPLEIRNGEIVINDWLAEDLQLSEGDNLVLEYFLLGPDQELGEASSTFTVREVVPIDGPAGDRTLMPDFPGLAEVESSFDWEPGIPIDLDRIRDKDEQYWELYRGTPKAFLTLTAAQRMWENRFGNLTAIRYPAAADANESREMIAGQILDTLEPESAGIRVVAVKAEGIRAGSGAVDFGQLFIGLSFFLLGAAVLLNGLFYALSIEQRAEETGVLQALGFDKRTIRRIRLAEGSLLALVGSLVGAALGILYNQALLHGLSTVWRGAVGVSSLELQVKASTLLLGALSGIIIAVVTMWITSARQTLQSPAELQRPGSTYPMESRNGWIRFLFLIPGALLIVAAVVTVVAGISQEGNPTGTFFLAGGLLLVGSLLLGYFFLIWMQRSVDTTRISVLSVGFRGIARRPKRSAAVAGLFAFGIFIVFAVGTNRIDLFIEAEDRESGTGGFALYGETTIPIVNDLNDKQERVKIGLPGNRLDQVSFVQLRVHEGDDASCLNLNLVQNPRILGVPPEEFARRGSFSFAQHPELQGGERPWQLLEAALADDVIPAVVDHSVMTWGLHKSIGDTLAYTDERGQEFKLKLVGSLENSVFQGSVLISEENFIERFPSASGTQVFLVDAPVPQTEQLSEIVRRALRDFGLELLPAVVRLAEFNRVQNTYLSIFLLLGGLGLVLGSFGMGLVVARNVLERRGELALLRAVGISRGMLQRILLSEHLFLLGFGLLSGLISSILAVLPVVLHRGTGLPLPFLGILIAAVAVNGCVWTYLTVLATTRGDLLPALRNE